MKYESSKPIYLQVMDSLKQRMVTGDLRPGDQLPSVRLLAIEYDINPNTAARVYKELELEGICFTKRGEGTFVTEDPDLIRSLKEQTAKSIVKKFIKEMTGLGYDKFEIIQKIQKEGDENDSIENGKTD
ncbi:MAG: GntR family transcriptional regulator [Clostridia bacterium]|jgi:GntR family transcriptional regulator|nr:GntR family transcriptional regulator [Clostridiaceae bacterium]